MLAGHIAAERGDYVRAIEHMRVAARQEDELVYGEPPEWTVPVRQDAGRILLRAGRYADAERAFRQDLDRFPENGWSLRGLAEALRGQGRTAESDGVFERFERGWAGGEVRY